MGQREICIFNPFSGRKVVSSNYTSILVLYWTQFTWKWLKALFSFMVCSIYHVCNTGPSRIRGSILILTSSKDSVPMLKSNTIGVIMEYPSFPDFWFLSSSQKFTISIYIKIQYYSIWWGEVLFLITELVIIQLYALQIKFLTQ